MKATGIVRRMDDLGRVVIPKEIRRTFGIKENDPIEIFTDNDGLIILKKYVIEGECVFCGSKNPELVLNGKLICEECKNKIEKSI